MWLEIRRNDCFRLQDVFLNYHPKLCWFTLSPEVYQRTLILLGTWKHWVSISSIVWELWPSPRYTSVLTYLFTSYIYCNLLPKSRKIFYGSPYLLIDNDFLIWPWSPVSGFVICYLLVTFFWKFHLPLNSHQNVVKTTGTTSMRKSLPAASVFSESQKSSPNKLKMQFPNILCIKVHSLQSVPVKVMWKKTNFSLSGNICQGVCFSSPMHYLI